MRQSKGGGATASTDPSPAGSSSAHAAAFQPSDRRPPLSERFEALLCDLRSENPNRRIPAVRLARDQRLQDPAHVGAIVALWQQAENEHVRAGAGEVLVAVAPQLIAPHLAAVIDSLADPSQFARLAAVGILQKMQGHGLLPQEVLHQHDARLMRALQAEHCDEAVRDLVANEIMTVAFAPGGLGADSAGRSFHAAVGTPIGSSSGGSGGGGGGGSGGGGSGSGGGDGSGGGGCGCGRCFGRSDWGDPIRSRSGAPPRPRGRGEEAEYRRRRAVGARRGKALARAVAVR